MQFGAQVSRQSVLVTRSAQGAFTLRANDIQAATTGRDSTWTQSQVDAIAKEILDAR